MSGSPLASRTSPHTGGCHLSRCANPNPVAEHKDIFMNARFKRLLVTIVVAAVAGPGFANAPSPAPTSWELSGQFQNVSNPAGPYCSGVGSNSDC